jgi:hypothetical protein
MQNHSNEDQWKKTCHLRLHQHALDSWVDQTEMRRLLNVNLIDLENAICGISWRNTDSETPRQSLERGSLSVSVMRPSTALRCKHQYVAIGWQRPS